VYLEKLSIVNFKNYESAELELNNGVNCFVGDNASGKTNLLDAVHYLSLCKSYFNPIDSQNILHEAPFFVIQGKFMNSDHVENIHCGIKRNQRKQFKRNNKLYEKLADHIGLIPIVMISPSDLDLIIDGSEIRRKFLDGIISQFNREYLANMVDYNRVISQRNALLKQFAQTNSFDKESLEVWDEKLCMLAKKIYHVRKEFIGDFIPIFQKHYENLVDGKEAVNLVYQSQLNEGAIEDLLKEGLHKDKILQRSTVGVHKDDLIFKIEEYPLKKFGSQGQQKSYVIAMKLAQFEFIKDKTSRVPLLLLDDIYDRLDNARVGKLMEMIASNSFGQLFITDTNSNRLSELFETLKVPVKVYEIQNGEVKS